MKQETTRHSLSHIMAFAVQKLYPDVKFGIGPAIENGFYYDFGLKNPITLEDLPIIEREMRELIGQDIKFVKKCVSKSEAEKIFASQPYKIELVNELEGNITIYETILPSGAVGFIDLCAGPHVESTKEIPTDAFKLLKLAGAYWRGSEKNQMLTRIYGLAFETKKELEDYLKLQEETEKRDHRKLGPQLDLFMFHETAPGMAYWLPKGIILLNQLLDFWRKEHIKYGYKEIRSPLLNKKELYITSGHWDHYREEMFLCETEESEIYGLKPMNCPNAMIVFGSKSRSYRELPLRLSDCDILHRYERSGTLNGLLRVREFTQDDAHIFISEDQIKEEYEKIFEIAEKFYSIFNLEYSFRFGTRPEKFMGDVSTWDKAEKELKEILKGSKKPFVVLEGDGAFYGPKIDILMKDSLGREWQLGTIQLDFQIPKNFKLTFIDKDGKEKTPVVIHRVIYGSLERFIGILTEHFGGAFPLWISPIQACVIPISETHNKYAEQVVKTLVEADIRCELSNDNDTVSKRIRNGEMQKIPYLLVVGDKEVKAKSVAVRSRGKKEIEVLKLTKFLERIKMEVTEKK
ncbi:MAG: threonine--tRNA ligase [Patescibacteria group bacterium]